MPVVYWVKWRTVLVSTRRGFPGGASGKEPTCQCRRHKRHRFEPWVGKISQRRAWKPTPEFLPGEPDRPQSIGSHRVSHDWSDSACRRVFMLHPAMILLTLRNLFFHLSPSPTSPKAETGPAPSMYHKPLCLCLSPITLLFIQYWSYFLSMLWFLHDRVCVAYLACLNVPSQKRNICIIDKLISGW